MIEIITLMIVFGSVIAIVAIACYFGYREEELKTKLRLRELEEGFPPGTYSKISKKDLKRARKMDKMHPNWQEDEEEVYRRHSEEAEREELLKGIANLKARIDNIDTIMSKQKEERK